MKKNFFLSLFIGAITFISSFELYALSIGKDFSPYDEEGKFIMPDYTISLKAYETSYVRAVLVMSEITKEYLYLDSLVFTNEPSMDSGPVNDDSKVNSFTRASSRVKVGGECFIFNPHSRPNFEPFDLKIERIDRSPYYRLADRSRGNQIAYVLFFGESQLISDLPGSTLYCYKTGKGY